MEALPSPLSSRPERSVVERSAVSTVLPWECFSTERSGVERPAVSAVPSLEMFFDRAYPDFLLRVASDVHVCGSPQREPHADHQRHGSPQEIRGSGVEKSALQRSLPGNVFRQTIFTRSAPKAAVKRTVLNGFRYVAYGDSRLCIAIR